MATDQLTLQLATALTGAWLGAALYQVALTNPTLREAGGAGLGFARTHAKRRGTGIFFAALALLSVAAGALAWSENAGMDVLTKPLPLSSLFVTLGLAAALIALARGATANRVAESRYLATVKGIRGTASPAEVEKLDGALRVAARANAVTVAVVGLAVACYVLSALFVTFE